MFLCLCPVSGCVTGRSWSPHLAGILPVLLIPGTQHVLGDLARVGTLTLLTGHQVDVCTLDGIREITCKERDEPDSAQALYSPHPPQHPPTPISPPPPTGTSFPLVPLFLFVSHSYSSFPSYLPPNWSLFLSFFPPIGCLPH